ncbi:MAG: hypothetical protein KDD90_02260 [Sphingomonadaceae bacterium]|nr:hypothetical protein [Sphingomonadaceae bacterium]
MSFRYRHSACVVASEIELPEWAEFRTADTGTPDVQIGFGAAGECVGKQTHFAVSGIGRWRIYDGRQICIERSAGAADADIRLYTLGSAWGALGYQRGWAMWHASAAEIDGHAALFCGESGQGKSTMAAAMAQAGHTLVADDLSRVDPADGMIWRSSLRIKLWRDAIRPLALDEAALEADSSDPDRYRYIVGGGGISGAPLPIGAIFILEWGDALVVERLRGSEAVSAASQAVVYRKEFLEQLGLLTDHVLQAANIAAAVPVFRLTRPRDTRRLAECVKLVERMLAEAQRGCG